MKTAGMKFKTLYLLCTVLFLAGSLASADGLPVSPDRKHVQGSYTRITLDAKQIKDVETRRKITLCPDQKAKLDKIAGGPLGDIIVYSSRYNLCIGPDEGVQAIWIQKGFLDFPHSGLVTRKQQREKEKEIGVDDSPDDKEYADVKIVFDSSGEMYVDGKHMTLPEIVNQLDILNRKQPKDESKKMYRSVIFDPPPPINKKVDRKVLDLYNDIDGLCAKVGIHTQDDGTAKIGISL